MVRESSNTGAGESLANSNESPVLKEMESNNGKNSLMLQNSDHPSMQLVNFLLIGYPEWYKDLKGQQGKANIGGRAMAAQMMDSPLNFEDIGEEEKKGLQGQSLTDIIQQEVIKLMKGKMQMENNQVNFAHLGVFVGMNYSLQVIDCLEVGTWIVGTGASNHMCVDLKLMNLPKPVTKPTPVYFPDGTIKFVNHIGNILLSSKLTLHDALHVPSFKFNLLSVPKLNANANLKFTFYPKHCVL
ncbi:hypothetical protein Pint_23683 [Pistacia integerrima]|uniref:Uncharacterized protein n=1 Tax=Pistacia integerrima TaxID=434235 RepID=A0ACC0YKV2_9ROSI|nr:hypothetical protein Pint_23683 [Pistacia integerrima]